MARVTVEDCVLKIPNRFELVMLSAQRVRQIGSGSALLLDRDNDKNTVVSLREIAEEKVEPEDLKEQLIKNNQQIIEMDDSEDVIDSMDGEEEWNKIDKAAPEGGYGSDDIDEDDDEDRVPSLTDMAGGEPE